MADQNDLITVFVDDKEVAVPKGTNMIEAAFQAGVEIPHYCYHPKLSVVGNCRMCLVELGMPMRDRATGEPVLDEGGQQKIGWMPRPAIACATNAAPGLRIRTNTQVVKDCRNGVMEFLLINHPLDCPICDQAGECGLQEFAIDHGRGYSRFVENKVVKPKRTVLGPRVTLDDERCILCSRCIRFSKEIANDDVLGFVDRGSYSTLTCHPGKKLENNYSLNTVDICPVGALTSTDFRFKMRVWFLKETRSVCTESSVGANTLVGSREGKIYRITPRRNDAVNDTWMTDSGRVLYKQVDSDDRLHGASIKGEPVETETALNRAVEILRGGQAAIVGSGQASVEEQALLKKLAEAVKAVSVNLVAHLGEEDGLLLSADRTPNIRGALVTGLIESLPAEKLDGLAEAIDAGKVTTVLTHREDLRAAGLTDAQLGKISVIYLGTLANDTTRKATVVIPTLTVFEKAGSFVNQQFRLQTFEPAVPGPSAALNDAAALAKITSLLTDGDIPSQPTAVWKELAGTVPVLEGIAFNKIPADGLALDGSAWAGLSFPEKKSLHFEAAQEAATTA